MSDTDRYFHETWLGMVQPIDGLVVSIPVLVDAQCMERQPPPVQAKLVELCPPTRKGEGGPEGYTVANLQALLSELLGFTTGSFDVGDALPEALSLYVPEGRQTLRATMALRNIGEPSKTETADATPASLAGAAYEMLVWELPTGLDLDKPEAVTGAWDYPPAAKFDRLLRHCREGRKAANKTAKEERETEPQCDPFLRHLFKMVPCAGVPFHEALLR